MKGRLTGLDALRGVAALCVLGFHVHWVFGGWPIFARAYLAVDFFFMLSGYVMARTYEGRFRSLSPVSFLAIRFRRLAPTMAGGTLIGALYFLAIGTPPLRVSIMAAAGLLFVPFPVGRQFYMLNRAEWSVFFELLANIAHAALLWRMKTVHLLALAGACLMATVVYGDGSFLVGNITSNLAAGLPRVLLSYSLGIVIHREGWRLKAPIALPALILVAASTVLAFPGLDFVFVVAICPALIMSGAGSAAGRFGRGLGAISFPLYALHYPILRAGHTLGAGAPVAAITAIAMATAVAFARQKLPTIAWRRRVVEPASARKPAAAKLTSTL